MQSPWLYLFAQGLLPGASALSMFMHPMLAGCSILQMLSMCRLVGILRCWNSGFGGVMQAI